MFVCDHNANDENINNNNNDDFCLFTISIYQLELNKILSSFLAFSFNPSIAPSIRICLITTPPIPPCVSVSERKFYSSHLRIEKKRLRERKRERER